MPIRSAGKVKVSISDKPFAQNPSSSMPTLGPKNVIVWDRVAQSFCEGGDKFMMYSAAEDGKTFRPTLEVFPAIGAQLEDERIYEGDLILSVRSEGGFRAWIVRYERGACSYLLVSGGKSETWQSLPTKVARIGHSKEYPELARDVRDGVDRGALERVLSGIDTERYDPDRADLSTITIKAKTSNAVRVAGAFSEAIKEVGEAINGFSRAWAKDVEREMLDEIGEIDQVAPPRRSYAEH